VLRCAGSLQGGAPQPHVDCCTHKALKVGMPRVPRHGNKVGRLAEVD
jgi:hypothetical protein